MGAPLSANVAAGDKINRSRQKSEPLHFHYKSSLSLTCYQLTPPLLPLKPRGRLASEVRVVAVHLVPSKNRKSVLSWACLLPRLTSWPCSSWPIHCYHSVHRRGLQFRRIACRDWCETAAVCWSHQRLSIESDSSCASSLGCSLTKSL